MDTTLMAVSRSNTPARVAAGYSPMLCPAIIAGCHAIGLDQFGQGVLDGEQGGLGTVGVLEVAPGPIEDLRRAGRSPSRR